MILGVKEAYYEAETPGLWKHVSRPIQFLVVVDDFFVEHVAREHAEYPANVLKKLERRKQMAMVELFVAAIIRDYTII